jgi:uncharacterized RDD family membrane protein YckC
MIAMVALLAAAMWFSYGKESFHSPRFSRSPAGHLVWYSAVAADPEARAMYRFRHGTEGAPHERIPLDQALFVAVPHGTLTITRESLTLRGQFERSRPTGVSAEPIAFLYEQDGLGRLFGTVTGGAGLVTWRYSWGEIAGTLERAPKPLDYEVVSRDARAVRGVWPYVLGGALHVAWHDGLAREVVWARRGERGWTIEGREPVAGVAAVFAHSGAAWLATPVHQLGRVGSVRLRVRPLGRGEGTGSVLQWEEQRWFGKRMTGLAAVDDGGMVEIWMTRPDSLQRARIERAGDTWQRRGDLDLVRRSAAWRRTVDFLTPAVLLLVSLPFVAAGVRMFRQRRRLLGRLRNVPVAPARYAGAMERAVAFFIDSMILAPPAIVLLEYLEIDPDLLRDVPRAWVLLSDAGLLAAIQFLYFFPMEWIAGRTIGKSLVGIRVVAAHGGRAGGLRAFARNLMRIVDSFHALVVVGFVSILLTRRNQRLGDLAAGTCVVPEECEEEAGENGR